MVSIAIVIWQYFVITSAETKEWVVFSEMKISPDMNSIFNSRKNSYLFIGNLFLRIR